MVDMVVTSKDKDRNTVTGQPVGLQLLESSQWMTIKTAEGAIVAVEIPHGWKYENEKWVNKEFGM